MIKKFFDFINEGVDFEGNFTPLYHITGSISDIIKSDTLKVGRPARGPRGICFTRSKYFSHRGDIDGGAPRIILNRELLIRDGYKLYPLDEWSLARPETPTGSTKFGSKSTWPLSRDKWVNKEVLKKHFGKSQFPQLVSGKRPISHGIESLPKKKGSRGLEVEYEERILKDIKNLGKYIYAFNFESEDQYTQQPNLVRPSYKQMIDEYKKKYPHIKVLLGLTSFKELN